MFQSKKPEICWSLQEYNNSSFPKNEIVTVIMCLYAAVLTHFIALSSCIFKERNTKALECK